MRLAPSIVVLTWPSCLMPVGPHPLWHANLPGMSCPTWPSKLSVPLILRRRSTARLPTTFSQRFAWCGSFIRIPVGSTSISRRRTSAFWNAPTLWMAARYCPAFGYPLPDYTKPWPNQNNPSTGPRSPYRDLEACGGLGRAWPQFLRLEAEGRTVNRVHSSPVLDCLFSLWLSARP